MSKRLTAFFAENEGRIIHFGEYFLEKLSDRTLMDTLAEKDPEKLARIFKMIFCQLPISNEQLPDNHETAIEQLLAMFSTESGDK